MTVSDSGALDRLAEQIAMRHDLGGGRFVPDWATGALILTKVTDSTPVVLDDDTEAPRGVTVERWSVPEHYDFGVDVTFRPGGSDCVLRIWNPTAALRRSVGGDVDWAQDLGCATVMRTRTERRVTTGGRTFTIPAGSTFQLDPTTFGSVRRARRRRVNQQDLAEVAERYEAGGIEAVKKGLGVEDRQAWRYVKRARAADLLPPSARPTKAED